MTGFGSEQGIVPPGPDEEAQQQEGGGIDPALLAQMQQGAPEGGVVPTDGAPAPEGGQDPNQPQGPEDEMSDQHPLDLEGVIVHAIEAGAQKAAAATTVDSQDFAQLSAGILSLCQALEALQPKTDPGQASLEAAAITALQRHEAAQLQHAATVHATESRGAQAAQQAAVAASRPTPSRTSPQE